MAQQSIPIERRHAIWLANGGKCAYCSEPLGFAEVDIDHVLPESLLTNPKLLTETILQLGRSANFEIRSLANLLPAHRRCNQLKSNRKFTPQAFALFLEIAADNEPKVKALLQEIKRTDAKDALLVRLTQAIREGSIMPSELFDPLTSPTVLTLDKPIRFANEEIHAIAPDDVEALLNKSVFGDGGLTFYQQSGSDSKKSLQVDTCREFRAATTVGYYPRTSHEIKLSARFSTIDAILSLAARMRVPRASFVRFPHKGVVDLDLLPVELLPVVSPDDTREIAKLSGQTLADLLGRGDLTITRCSSKEIAILWHWGLVLTELCRSDFNNDGMEDILCECYCWAPGGTLGFGWNIILSRTSQNELFSVERL